MRHNHSDHRQRADDNSGWRPRNPPEDFSFPAAHSDDFDPDDWPADPSAYRPSSHFRQRFREYDRCFTSDRLRETIEAGNRVPALRDTCAFYLDRSGVAFYVIVGWDLSLDTPREDDERIAVTCWPWVYDHDKALDTGRWSTRILNRMMTLNGTLLNEQTADDFWLEYYAHEE
jgi:hypothetical protein